MNLANRMNANVDMVKALSESAATVTQIISNTLTRPNKKITESYSTILDQISQQVTNVSIRVQDMQVIVEDLEKLVGLVNIAGRQRMLSQRALRFHLLTIAMPDQTIELIEQIDVCQQEFLNASSILKKSDLNSDAILKMIAATENTWFKFRDSLSLTHLQNTLDWNDTLLNEVEILVQGYTSLIISVNAQRNV